MFRAASSRFISRENKVLPIFSKLFKHEDWNIGIIERPIESFLEDQTINDIKWLARRPKGGFTADPFGFWDNGRLHIYAEEFNFARNKGHLRYVIIDKARRVLREGVALFKDVHLSYPYIIGHQGALYCLPEMSRSNKVVLFAIDRHTGQLMEKATLLAGVTLSDPTVFHHDGQWWLWGVKDGSELHVWYASDLFGPWQAHADNPVKTDIASARPAGTPFVHDGSLYRPAQDCSRTYGGRIVLNKVLALSPTEFREEIAAVIEPDPHGLYPVGIHTLAAAGDITLVDGKRWTFSLGRMARKVIRKCSRSLRRENVNGKNCQ